jgi:hypothetical protein
MIDIDPLHNANTPLSKLPSNHLIMSHMLASKAGAQGTNLGWWWWWWSLPFHSLVRKLSINWPPRILELFGEKGKKKLETQNLRCAILEFKSYSYNSILHTKFCSFDYVCWESITIVPHIVLLFQLCLLSMIFLIYKTIIFNSLPTYATNNKKLQNIDHPL